MKNRYLSALLSSTLSIAPIIIIVIILSLVLKATGYDSLQLSDYHLLVVGMLILIVGLSLFQIGASSSLSKVGEYMGSSLSKQDNLFVVIVFSLALGALITCAEPSILIVSTQINIPSVVLIASIALGVGVFVVIGVLRIICHGSLKVWYLLFYFITFLILLLVFAIPDPDGKRKAFLPFIFDSGGVTTGSATVPFILSLGAGIALVRGGKNAGNDSFGLVGMASIGPIISMSILILISNNAPAMPEYADIGSGELFIIFIRAMLPHDGALGSGIEVLIALSPILVIFFIYNAIFIKLPKNRILKLIVGFVFTLFGLTLFLGAAGAAMTPIGNFIGKQIGNFDNGLIILIAFVIGMVSILCEPAVHVLTTQMETISDGRIKKKTVLIALSCGVGFAIALSAMRVIYQINIMYIMIPGYLTAILLMFICPTIYTALAFDSGGTASGPMSTSFVLPMIVGIATTLTPSGFQQASFIYEFGFGVVAMIALTPVIAIQILGVFENVKDMYQRYVNRKNVYSAADAQIIHF